MCPPVKRKSAQTGWPLHRCKLANSKSSQTSRPLHRCVSATRNSAKIVLEENMETLVHAKRAANCPTETKNMLRLSCRVTVANRNTPASTKTCERNATALEQMPDHSNLPRLHPQGSSLSCCSTCTWLRRTFWSHGQDKPGHHDEPSCLELIEAPKRHNDLRKAHRAGPRGPSHGVPRWHRGRVSRQKQLVLFLRRSLKLSAARLQLKPPTTRPPWHGKNLTLNGSGESGIPHFTQKKRGSARDSSGGSRLAQQLQPLSRACRTMHTVKRKKKDTDRLPACGSAHGHVPVSYLWVFAPSGKQAVPPCT